MVTHSRSHDSPPHHEIFNVDSLIEDVGITTLLFHLGPGHVNGAQKLKKSHFLRDHNRKETSQTRTAMSHITDLGRPGGAVVSTHSKKVVGSIKQFARFPCACVRSL